MTHRTLSLREAVRYFGQADPPQLPQQKFFHQASRQVKLALNAASIVLQLHTVSFARNVFDRSNPEHFVMLCPDCHKKAHA